MKRILFVCVENSCRSQIAEAFANRYGEGRLQAHSAGSRPRDVVNENAIRSMKAAGYDLSPHRPKSLNDVPDVEYDYAVTMGCGDACPHVRAKRRLDWAVPDPKDAREREFDVVRDLIEDKVRVLIDAIDEEE